MAFLDEGYKVPQSNSRYMKLKDGDNIFRILDKATMGWLDWKTEGDGSKKPIRTKYEGEASKPKPLNPKQAVKHFWAFPIYDYADKQIKVLEVTQATIQNAIYTYHCDVDFGDPTGYDIKINKQGEKLSTEYAVLAKPPKPLDAEIGVLYAQTPVNCEALLTNGDPFEDSKPKVVESGAEEEVNIDEIDFETPPVSQGA